MAQMNLFTNSDRLVDTKIKLMVTKEEGGINPARMVAPVTPD